VDSASTIGAPALSFVLTLVHWVREHAKRCASNARKISYRGLGAGKLDAMAGLLLGRDARASDITPPLVRGRGMTLEGGIDCRGEEGEHVAFLLAEGVDGGHQAHCEAVAAVAL
jgi:hypothetical protein